MQFHIDRDEKSVISGWLTPDNPSMVPSFIIACHGQPEIQFSATVLRPEIKQQGHHSSGLVGFHVDETIVPNLGGLADLQIFEAETRTLIHRRFQGLNRKLFVFDFCTLPDTLVHQILPAHFSLCYGRVERYPFDSLYSILNNQSANSILAAGRPSLLRYQEVLNTNGYLVTALVRSPYEALAERLRLIFELASSHSLSATDEDSSELAGLIDIAKATQSNNPVRLEATFDALTENQANVISNPVVRALACGIGDAPTNRHVAVALNNLATMDLVGIYARFDEFKTVLSEILAHEVLAGFEPPDTGGPTPLAAQLSSIRSVRKMLALDLALYNYVEEAIRTATPNL